MFCYRSVLLRKVPRKKISTGKINTADRGGVILFVISLVLLLSVLLGVLYYSFGETVPPGYIGVRHNGYDVPGFLKKGYSDIGLEPGLHWSIPYISNVVLLPRGFQFINYSGREAKFGDLNGRALEVPTSDGSKVQTDITMVLRFYPRPLSEEPQLDPSLPVIDGSAEEIPLAVPRTRKHEGPKELVEHLRIDSKKQLQQISLISHDFLKQELSSLSTTEFYDPVLRESAALRAHESINNRVSNDGVELWGTLIRRYVYSEQNIDDQIFAKILQDQTTLLNTAAKYLAEAQAETETERAGGDARIRDLQVQGEADVKILRSEGELYEAKKKAAGDLLVAKAYAEVDSQKARALHEISGAEIYIGRELAPILGTLKGGVVTDVDPYDIQAWVDKLTNTKK